MTVTRHEADRLAGVVAIPGAVAVITTVGAGLLVLLLALVVWGLTR